jgi:hypothetical protein
VLGRQNVKGRDLSIDQLTFDRVGRHGGVGDPYRYDDTDIPHPPPLGLARQDGGRMQRCAAARQFS